MQIKIPSVIPTDSHEWEDVLVEMEEGTTIDFINPETYCVIARFQPDDLEALLVIVQHFNEKNKSSTS